MKCGEGDWAYAHRSPSGRLVARVSPFEPAYGYFVELCRRCPGNRYLPRIELATPLEGGGHLTVLEHLRPADPGVAGELLRRWTDPADSDSDAELRALRREVDAIHDRCRRSVRWWGGVDIGDRHVRLDEDGQPKLIDLFYVAGERMLADLLSDPVAFRRDVPAERRRHLLDIPDLRHDHPAGYLRRIRAALA